MQQDILILGANGQLGFDLVKVFTGHNLKFKGLTRYDFNPLKPNWEQCLINYAPRYIINCIATTNVDECENKPDLAFMLNSSFVYQLAKFCHLHAITLMHISTDYVFDGTNNVPYTELNQPNPLNIYGLSKYAGELALQQYHGQFFLFRVSSLFGQAGASGKGGNFITTMQRLGREHETVKVIGDQFTCPTSTWEVAKCICYFIQNAIMDYGIYHCVSKNSCSWFEFAQQIFTLSNLNINKLQAASFATYNFKAKRPQYGIMAIDKLNKYYLMPTWQESLAAYFAAN